MSQINGVAEDILLKHDLADYPIEIGEKNGWIYEKRNSGIVKCWGTFKVNVGGKATLQNGMHGCHARVDIPDFLISIDHIDYTGYWTNGYDSMGKVLIHDGFFNVYVISNTDGGDQLTVFPHIIGRWKPKEEV